MIAELKVMETQIADASQNLARQSFALGQNKVKSWHGKNLKLRDELLQNTDPREQIQLKSQIAKWNAWIQSVRSIWQEWRQDGREDDAQSRRTQAMLTRVLASTNDLNFNLVQKNEASSPAMDSSEAVAETLKAQSGQLHLMANVNAFTRESIQKNYENLFQKQRESMQKQLQALNKHAFFGKLMPYITAIVIPILTAVVPGLVATMGVATALLQKLLADFLVAAGTALVNLAGVIPQENQLEQYRGQQEFESGVQTELNKKMTNALSASELMSDQMESEIELSEKLQKSLLSY